jgi:hypothetical protein
MPHAAGTKTKWSDQTFLDGLRDMGDPLAERCARDLPREQSLAFVFAKMRIDAELPAELPGAFATFLADAQESLSLSDLTEDQQARLLRGQKVFMTHALPGALVLLMKSLQDGYQAPRLSEILMLTGGLQKDTYRRLLGVLQMLLHVMTPHSFAPKPASGILPHSEVGLTAARVRLMHAGIRGIAAGKFPDFAARHGGVPISLEDMLATLIAFSSLLMDGFHTLDIALSEEEAEDYHFAWCVFARTMGIHPPGMQKSWEWVPATLAEAHEFYDSYRERHYRQAPDNPQGLRLADANLQMLKKRLPFGLARIYMNLLNGAEACERLGIPRVRLKFTRWWLARTFPRAWVGLWRTLDERNLGVAKHERITQWMLQKLILWEYDAGLATYRVPRSLDEVKEVVQGTQPGLSFGREQFERQVFPRELVDITARRKAVDLDASPLAGLPNPDQGLVGLALSGGGIRSATFALGAVQALAKARCLRMVDYLSTLSGGGYTGSALSSLLNDPDARPDGKAFPLAFERGALEPPALRHLRSGSNYLAGATLLDEARLPAILLRGLLLNMLLLLPYIMLAVAGTMLVFPFAHEKSLTTLAFQGTLAAFLLLVWSYPAVTWLRRGMSWEQRNLIEKMLVVSLLAFAFALIVALLSDPVGRAITSDWTSLRAKVRDELANTTEASDWWKWALGATVVIGTVWAWGLAKSPTRRVNQAALYLLGMTGPAVVFLVYLLLLLAFARSPFLPGESVAALDAASRAAGAELTDPTLLADLRIRGVETEGTIPTVSADAGGASWTVNVPARTHTVARSNGFLSVLWADLRVYALKVSDWSTRISRDPVEGRWNIQDPPRSVKIVRDGEFVTLRGVEFGAEASDWWFLVGALVLFVLNLLWVDVNITSPHGFRRDRLSRVFLFRARWFGRPTPNDRLKLSELGTGNPAVPYHLLNASLNLAGSRVEDLPGRGSDFFIFSRRFVGSYATGYCRTEDMEEDDPHLDLGTAMAISAAETAPNAGTTTVKPLVFVMTLLNARLDYWLPNPWYVQGTSLVRRMTAKHLRPGPWYLFREATGQLHARGSFVNLSDGGHVENLAMFELLRRRCKLIIAVDAEQDPSMACTSLARLIRHARIDLGIEIEIDTRVFNPDASGRSAQHFAIGSIRYDDAGAATGTLLLVKASMTGDEAPYVLEYHRRNPEFPQEAASDQFFDEAQFESYRALGYHAMNDALKAAAALAGREVAQDRLPDLAVVRDSLGLAPPKPASAQGAIT